ncbi:MAG: DegT/DnrJ/EryC1/StrS family aminotransferase, partial [Phycisphaerae bacterium]
MLPWFIEASPTGKHAMSQAITVPLLDLKVQYAALRAELEPVMQKVFESAYYIGGPDIAELEKEIAAYSKARHAIACANGSDA